MTLYSSAQCPKKTENKHQKNFVTSCLRGDKKLTEN